MGTQSYVDRKTNPLRRQKNKTSSLLPMNSHHPSRNEDQESSTVFLFRDQFKAVNFEFIFHEGTGPTMTYENPPRRRSIADSCHQSLLPTSITSAAAFLSPFQHPLLAESTPLPPRMIIQPAVFFSQHTHYSSCNNATHRPYVRGHETFGSLVGVRSEDSQLLLY